jgi:hypothetical protein
MLWHSRIYVAGLKNELVGRIVHELKRQGHDNLIETIPENFSLFNQAAVDELFSFERPEYVFFVSSSCSELNSFFIEATANSKTVTPDFCELRYKLSICELNVIHAARANRCRKFLFIDCKEDGVGGRYCAALAKEEGACFLCLQSPPLNSSVAIDSFAAHCVELMKKPLK